MTDAAAREGKLLEVTNIAARAAAELELTGAAFKKLRATFVEAWQATDPRDDKGREKLWVATTVLTQTETALRRLVTNGEVAKKEIEAIRTAGERKGFLARRQQARST